MNFNFHAILLMWFSIISTVLLQFVHPSPATYRGRYIEPKCKDTQTGRELFIGDAYTRRGQCVRVQCLGDLNIWEDRCQVPQLNGNCSSIPPVNQYLDYPKCCPTYDCKKSEVSDAGETEEIHTYDHYGILKRTRIRQVFFRTEPIQGSAVPVAQFNVAA